jgi:hypothetical protein
MVIVSDTGGAAPAGAAEPMNARRIGFARRIGLRCFSNSRCIARVATANRQCLRYSCPSGQLADARTSAGKIARTDGQQFWI